MKRIGKLLTLFLLTNNLYNANSQDFPVSRIDSIDKKYLNWYNLDKDLDQIPGASVDKAYRELLPGKQAKRKVVVAVIDGGVDIRHEDLKDRIWVNTKEIPGNNIDDDHNGYVDDVNGWNFIGNSKGENIRYENLEYTRLYKELKPRFDQIASDSAVPVRQREDYRLFVRCRDKYLKEYNKYQSRKFNLDQFDSTRTEAEKTIKKFLGKDSFTREELLHLITVNNDVIMAKDFMLQIYKGGYEPKSYQAIKKRVTDYLDAYLNLNINPRKIIADNTEDINDKLYGNNDVTGPDASHGTFVAGIIGAVRNNNVGINGIAENVEIMVLRVVPDGDERDKDVALAIRYAADNGADIINMSFGKAFSPQKRMVDDAIRYAMEKKVLIIHSAGNDAWNTDEEEVYPSYKFSDGTVATNMINVGAICMEDNKKFCGVFSNYGKNTVHLFAPGCRIVSLQPGNKYQIWDGTSFSCPVVTGVAALILSYYPMLKPTDIKDILLNSCTTYPKLKVYYPCLEKAKKKTRFSELSVTGGVVNAFQGLKMAESYHP